MDIHYLHPAIAELSIWIDDSLCIEQANCQKVNRDFRILHILHTLSYLGISKKIGRETTLWIPKGGYVDAFGGSEAYAEYFRVLEMVEEQGIDMHSLYDLKRSLKNVVADEGALMLCAHFLRQRFGDITKGYLEICGAAKDGRMLLKVTPIGAEQLHMESNQIFSLAVTLAAARSGVFPVRLSSA